MTPIRTLVHLLISIININNLLIKIIFVLKEKKKLN